MAGKTNQGETGRQWEETLPIGVDKYRKVIDEDWDSFGFDITTPTPRSINGHLLHRIVTYIAGGYSDTNLWECFKEDFEGWTIDIWKLANGEIVRDMRNFLRRYGVMVEKNGGPITQSLQEIIDNTEEPVWTEEEIEY